jgi:PrcB C-terminal
MLATRMLTMCICAAAGLAQAGEPGRDLKVLARDDWPYGRADPEAPKKQDLSVIRTPTQLTMRPPWSELDALPKFVEKSATAAVVKLLKAPSIDWDKQMLIVVTAGSKASGGWKVNIDSVKVQGKTLKVEWSATPPDGFATQAFTHPGQVILVERFDGPVMFAEKAKKAKTP